MGWPNSAGSGKVWLTFYKFTVYFAWNKDKRFFRALHASFYCKRKKAPRIKVHEAVLSDIVVKSSAGVLIHPRSHMFLSKYNYNV